MADLPSGTVTFLFTDIEGSTALWERHRSTMVDAVYVAYPTAPLLYAVAATGDAACARHNEDWGTRGRPRLRDG
jgi:hypothetical protein